MSSRFSMIIFGVLALVYIALSGFAVRGKIDNSLEVWIDENNPETQIWKDFVAAFGSSEFVVVAIDIKKDQVTHQLLTQVSVLEKQLRNVKNIASVVGPGKVYDEMCDLDLDGYGDDFEEWQEIQKSSFAKSLIAGDKMLGIFLRVRHDNSPSFRRDLSHSIRQVLAQKQFENLRFHVVGSPILNAELDQMSQTTAQIIFPIAFAVMFLVMLLFFRHILLCLVLVVSISLAIGATLGTMALNNTPLNMLTVAMPSLLLVLAGANGIHILYRFVSCLDDMPPQQAITQAFRDLWRPCVGAMVTTAVGFLSLVISPIAAVQEFGIYTALGIGFCILAILGISPVLLLLCSKHIKVSQHAMRWPRFLQSLGQRYAISITLISMVFIALSVMYSLHPIIRSNVLDFIPKTHPIHRDYEAVSQNLTGLFSVEIDVKITSEEIPWLWLDQLSTSLENLPYVSKVYGPVHILREMQAERLDEPDLSTLPEDTNVDILVISMKGIVKQEWETMVKKDQRHMRISLLVNNLDSQYFGELVEKIDNTIENPIAGVTLHRTGIISLVNETQKDLLRTQLSSFSLAAVIIFAMFFVFVPNYRVALLAIPVNFAPPLMTFAVMVVSGIEINPGTVMIASVAIGIAIDDTMHFCHRFVSLPREMPIKVKIEDTLSHVGPPMWVTSIVISCGFAVLLFAEFLPLQYFGILTALAVVLAFICDVLMLPALISVCGFLFMDHSGETNE